MRITMTLSMLLPTMRSCWTPPITLRDLGAAGDAVLRSHAGWASIGSRRSRWPSMAGWQAQNGGLPPPAAAVLTRDYQPALVGLREIDSAIRSPTSVAGIQTSAPGKLLLNIVSAAALHHLFG